MTEAELTKNVIDAAHIFGWLVAHFRPGLTKAGNWITPMQGDKGFPDLVLARNGEVILAELKVGKNKLTPDQLVWMAHLQPVWPTSEGPTHGYYVWTDQDWDDNIITGVLR